jgi:hypothetical protein
MRAAAKYVVGALDDGGADAAADWFAKRITEHTWQEVKSGEPRRRCHRLARLAQDIIKVKNKVHKAAGDTAAALTNLLGGSKIEQVFAAELAQRIPQPLDTKLDTLARCLRITGILRCVTAGLDPYYCECLGDLITAEGPERAKRLLLYVAKPPSSSPS